MAHAHKVGMIKFLQEKPIVGLDDNMLYVLKENFKWRKFMIKKQTEECTKILKELVSLEDVMCNDLR